MPQTPASFTPAERLAAQICRFANARETADAAPALAQFRRRSKAAGAAVKAALDRGWLRRNGDGYVVTPAGAALGRSRSGKRTGRVLPF